MPKIAVNRCYGGFNLSHEAILLYASKKGITLYPEEDKKYPSLGMITYWTLPEDQRPETFENWMAHSPEERQANNAAHRAARLYDRDLPRDDPHLIEVIEELGDEVNGPHANLGIIEIPEDVEWEISEYDGMEHVAEKHRVWY